MTTDRNLESHRPFLEKEEYKNAFKAQ